MMTEAELSKLEEIRQEALAALVKKYGQDKVQQVNLLDANITWRMINGEQILGIEQWMYDVVNDFQNMILSHPAIKIPIH